MFSLITLGAWAVSLCPAPRHPITGAVGGIRCGSGVRHGSFVNRLKNTFHPLRHLTDLPAVLNKEVARLLAMSPESEDQAAAEMGLDAPGVRIIGRISELWSAAVDAAVSVALDLRRSRVDLMDPYSWP
jgi:hypothetical protein